MTARLLIFTMSADFWLLSLPWISRGRNENKASLNVTKLIRTQLFFLNKHSPDCYKPLVNFNLKKLNLTIFANILVAFMEERIFRGPYLLFSLMSLEHLL